MPNPTVLLTRRACRAEFLRPQLISLAIALSACSDDAGSSDTPSDVGNAALVDAAAPLDAGPCVNQQRQACTCASGNTGERVCSNGSFGACENCATYDASTSTSLCVPGHYVGPMKTTFVPSAAGFCGLFTVFGGEGSGTWEFTLSASGSTEFFQVEANTCITLMDSDAGAAMPTADGKPPPRLSLTGKVDCKTGELKGEIKGFYRTVSFCNSMEENYFYKGPVTAVFDPKTNSFKNGTLKLREPPVLIPLAGEAGGDGTWSATLVPEAEPVANQQDCFNGIMFRDDLFPDGGA